MARFTRKAVKPGRPTKLTPALADEICRRLAREPINVVFADPKMPSKGSFYNWILDDAEFFNRSARGRAIAALREMDEAELEFERADEKTNVALLRERLQHCRWKVSKLLPKTYGERLALSGPGGGPIETRETGVDLSKLSTPTLRKVVEELRAFEAPPEK